MNQSKLPLLIIINLLTCINVSCREKIETIESDLQRKENINFQLIPFLQLKDWTEMQGGAIINDLLVYLTSADRGQLPNGFIYSLTTGEKICDLCFTSMLYNKEYSMPHETKYHLGGAITMRNLISPCCMYPK